MSQSRVRDAFLGRLRRSDDDRGSIALVMLVILVSTCIGALLLAMLISQNRTTRFASSRVQTLQSAQSGIQVMLGQIRSATSTDTTGVTYGDANNLPCGPMSGSANATGTTSYTVSVAYYLTNPATAGSTPMACSPGNGPYNLATANHTPLYALITSTGTTTGGAGTNISRTLHATYTLRTEINQIRGGLLQANGYCLAASSAAPLAGSIATLQSCDATNPAQLWAYNTNLSISLASTLTNASTGMCIDRGSSLPTAGLSGPVSLQPCSTSSPYPAQMFALAAGYSFMATAPDGRTQNNQYNPDLANICLTTANALSAPLMIVNVGIGGGCTSLTPDASVGAGPAGTGTAQFVNYARFGKCLDVGGSSYPGALIGYPCTVETPVANTPGNQRWHFGTADPSPSSTAPVSGSIWSYRNNPLIPVPSPAFTATDSNQKYCMYSQGTVGSPVTLTACSNSAIAGPPANQNWTVYRTTSSSGSTLNYASSYRIVDFAGLCLADASSSGTVDQIVMQTCSSSLSQKWNADPNVLTPSLGAYGEN